MITLRQKIRSNGPKTSYCCSTRFNLWKRTALRSSSVALIFPASGPKPFRRNCLWYSTGTPESLWLGQIPFEALASTFVERSVPRTSVFQPVSTGNAASSIIAREYGSSPVEHAALQARKVLGRRSESAEALHSGKTCWRRQSKDAGSRKK